MMILKVWKVDIICKDILSEVIPDTMVVAVVQNEA